MSYVNISIWSKIIIVLFKSVNLQIVPVYPAPYPPAPVGFAIHLPAQVPVTTEKPIGVAVPIPVVMPFQISFSAPVYPPKSRPSCPPCLCTPSCTPAFFSYCSPCHQRCRCNSPGETPAPQPPLHPIPNPFAMPVGIPPVIVFPYSSNTVEYKSSEECDNSSENYMKKRNRRKKKKYPRHRLNNFRRTYQDFTDDNKNDNQFFKPVLSYISRDGEVKFQSPISDTDVRNLLNKKEDNNKSNNKKRTIEIVTGSKNKNIDHLTIKSDDGGSSENISQGKVVLRKGVSHQVLTDGHKELIFRPANNKRISNLTVKFNIS